MKRIYEAAGLTDAQLIKDILEQHDIHAHIDGLYLQGAVGELPAHGLVAVSVDNQYADRALFIINDYLSAKPLFDDESGD